MSRRERRRRDVHVYPDAAGRGWDVSQGGRWLSRHRTQKVAIKAGKRHAQRWWCDLVTHGRDGKIRSKDSYGNESSVRDTEH